MTMYLVLLAFTSRPISLLAITKVSVFSFIVCTLLPSTLASLAWSPIIWTRKLTYFFWFLFSWKLTPVRGDRLLIFVPQFILQISITLFFHFFIQRWSSLHFPYLFPYVFDDRQSRMTQDTKFVHLTAASKQLFSCHCARTDWYMCILSLSATVLLSREWVRLQQAATFLLSQQKSCQCARSRIKQFFPTGQLNSWATKVASAQAPV